jgi:hypothetical protein
MTDKKKRIVCEDGWNCDPECPYLKPSENTNDVKGKCGLTGNDLDWYDWYLADCESEEYKNLDVYLQTR